MSLRLLEMGWEHIADGRGFVLLDSVGFTATAATDVARFEVENANAIVVPAGTTSVAASVIIGEPNLTATGTITVAATLYIEAAPTEGSSNYALFVDAGASRFDGTVEFQGGLTILDDIRFALGTDGDQVFVNRSTVLNTNTALTSVVVGTPVTPAIAANSLIISNITASGDILVAANNGGNSQAWLWVDSSAGTMTLYGAGTAVAITAATYFEIEDGILLAIGNDADTVLMNRTTILNANTALTGVLIGTPVTPAVAANSLIVSNTTASGDLLIAANLGGNSQAWLWIDSSASLMTLYGAGVSAIEIGTSIVVNESSADRDFRIEGDNNANMLVIDAGTDSMALGRAVIAGAYLAVDGSTVNRAGVTAVARHLHIPSVTVTQTNADPTSLALGAASYVGQTTFAGANPNQTIVDAASLIVAAAPAAGANMTLTRSWAAILGGRVGIGLDPTAITHDINNTTLVVFNEQAADIDFRVEGDNNANMLVIDAGTDSMAFGRAVVAGAFAALDGSAVNRDGVTAVGRGLHLPAATFTQTNADPTTLAVGARVFIGVPTFAGANPNQVISDASTLYIAGIPVVGANTTITRAASIQLGQEVNHVIRVLQSTTAGATVGGSLTITAGQGVSGAGAGNVGAGGALALAAGASGADSVGTTTVNGGAVTIYSGALNYQSSGTSGAVTIESGASDTANMTGGGTGAVILGSGTFLRAWGDAVTPAASGAVTIRTGIGAANANTPAGAAGTLSITGGRGGHQTVTGGGIGGAGAAIVITAGAGGNGVGTSGVPGDVTITAGAAGTGGNRAGGTMKFAGGAGVGTGTTGIVAATSGLLNDYRTITTISTDADVVFTAAQVRTGVINRDSLTANRNDSMPTAANLVAGLPGAYVGQSFFFVLNNNDDASTLTMTTAAAGITYEGNTAALAAGAARLYLVVITNVTGASEAATVFGL